LSYGWILKGERKSIPTTAKQRRLNIIGDICLSGHKIVHHECDKVDIVSINFFLKVLRQKNPGKHKIHIILDNAGYHKSYKVRDYAKAMKIKLHYLPPYSPNLNPIERLWKIMHEKVTYNKYYEKFIDFANAADQFFRTIGKKKRLLLSRITDNFQILQGVAFAP
jgi:transposase